MYRNSPIKYDKKQRKMWIDVLILSSIFILLGAVLFAVDAFFTDAVNGIMLNDIVTIIVVLIFILFYVAIPSFIVSLLGVIDSGVYLSRLKKNHYEVPDDKKKYRFDLAQLPRTEVVSNMYAKDSKKGAALFLAAYIIFVILDICYVVKWVRIGETDSVALFIMLMLGHLFFLVFAFILFSQRSTEKYCDDTDVREGKKARISITNAIIILVITSAISIFAITTAHTMTDYIYKSKNKDYGKTIIIENDENLLACWTSVGHTSL